MLLKPLTRKKCIDKLLFTKIRQKCSSNPNCERHIEEREREGEREREEEREEKREENKEQKEKDSSAKRITSFIARK